MLDHKRRTRVITHDSERDPAVFQNDSIPNVEMDTNNECPSGKNFLHFLSVGIIIFDRADPGFPYALAILSLGKLDRCQIGSVQQVSIDDLLGGAALQHPPALKQD